MTGQIHAINCSNNINDIDSIIFDCDGVLIDVRESFNETINKTVQYILNKFDYNDIIITHDIIDKFKATGRFNDEVDLCYVLILSTIAAKRLNYNHNNFINHISKISTNHTINITEIIINSLINIMDVKNYLKHPESTHSENILYQVFDQIFYGPKLYEKLFMEPSRFSESGLIEHDNVIVNNDLMDKLCKKFNKKIAILTGRGRASAEYSLESLIHKFDLENSVFLEDEPRELAKPNPKPLCDIVESFNSDTTLYVGDSFEDLIIAKKANQLGHKTIFCGIVGTSNNEKAKLELFKNHSDIDIIILDSIHEIPKVLNVF